MKKLFLSLGLGLAVAAGAVAAPQLDSAVTELNQEIKRLLQPYQNSDTKAALTFRAIKTDAVRALQVKLNGVYRKVGTQNKLEVKVQDVSYDYGNGKAPTTKIKGEIGLDITKVVPQKYLNEIIPGIEEMVQEFAREYARDYGDAAKVVAKVTEKKTDAEGNFVSIKAKVSGKIDLSKLPANVNVEDVLFTDARADVSIDLKKGLKLNVVLVSNPEYKGFDVNDKGLKESLENLLARDPKELKDIEDLFRGLDNMASHFVNGERE